MLYTNLISFLLPSPNRSSLEVITEITVAQDFYLLTTQTMTLLCYRAPLLPGISADHPCPAELLTMMAKDRLEHSVPSVSSEGSDC